MKPMKKSGRVLWKMGDQLMPEPLYVPTDFPFYIGKRKQIIPESCSAEDKAFLEKGNTDFIMAAKKRLKLKNEMGEKAFDDYMDSGGYWNQDGPDGPQAEFDNKALEEMEKQLEALEKKMDADEDASEVTSDAYPSRCKPPGQKWQAMSCFCDPADKSVLKQNWFLYAYGAEADDHRCHAYVHDCVARQRKQNGTNIPMKMYCFVPLDLTMTAKFHDPEVVRQIHTTQDQQERADYGEINRERAAEVNRIHEEGGFTRNLTPADPEYKASPEELERAKQLAEETPWEDERPRRRRIPKEAAAGGGGGGGGAGKPVSVH